MKDNFENTIKQSLEGYEMPYDASAWTALSQKLDVVKPVSTTPNNGIGKWIAAAGIVVAVSVGAYVYFQTNSNTKNTANNTQEINDSKNNSTNGVQLTKNEAKSNNTQNTHTDNVATKDQNTKTQDIELKSKNPNLDNQWFDKSSGKSNTPENRKEEKETSTAGSGPESPSVEPKTKALKVPATKDLCLGDAINIKNENDSDLILVMPNGKNQVIRKETSLNAKSKIAGEYRILSNGNEIASFKVNKLPNLDFTMDDQLVAEDGVPTVPVSTYSEGSKYTWIAEDVNGKLYGKSQNIHFFKKGTKTITLQAENEKGCVGEVSKTIKIEEDYNLFAPTAVDPSSSDRRKNRFIPRALNVRDVQFTMFIVDLKTGLTIYMTSDANEGWDGVDKNTGELVPEGSVYAWKVVLKNPLPGESSDYKGTVEVSNR